MLSTIISVACAVTLSASPVPSPADTLTTYLINGEKVAHFNGGQLVGKTVTDYRIGTAEKDGTIYRIHIINTADQVSNTSENTNQTVYIVGEKTETRSEAASNVMKTADMAVYVIDGKVATADEVKLLKPDAIAAITVLKPGGKDALKWTEDSSAGVVILELK